MILFEDFGQFLFGGESVRQFPGYSMDSRSSVTSITNPSGIIPATTSSADPYLVTPNTHMALFKTLRNAVGSTRLDTWADWVEANDHGAMCIENGCIKVGASKKTGDIVTPELSCLSGASVAKKTLSTEEWMCSPAQKSARTAFLSRPSRQRLLSGH